MINKNNESGGVEALLTLLVFSLTFSSVLVSFVLLQSHGYQTIGTEAPIIPPGAEATMGVQDYTTNTISDNYNYEAGYGDYQYQSGVGRVLVAKPSVFAYQWLLLKQVSPIDNVYTTTYKVNNSVKGDYAIAVRFKGSNPYDIVVRVESNGFHIRNEFIPLQEYNFYPYTGANQIIKPTIKTVYTINSDKTGTLQFYFNNNLVFTKSDIAAPGLINPDESIWYHAGVGSDTLGFTVESITVAGFSQYASTDILSQIGTFLEVMAKIILWNVNPAFLPWEINLILIKTQLAGIVICLIVIARG